MIVFLVLFLMCFLPSFAYYSFLSPECNIYLEELKEKFREEKTILENKLIETEDISNLKPEDQGSEPDPDDTEIGDTFTGPSGTTYILKPENISDQEREDLANLGYAASGVWVVIEEM